MSRFSIEWLTTWLMRVLLVAMLGGFGLAAFLGISMLVTGDPDEEKLVLISAAVLASAFCGMALAAAYVAHRRRLVALMSCGIVSSIGGCVLWLIFILNVEDLSPDTSERMARWAGLFTLLALGSAWTGLLALARARSSWLRVARLLVPGVSWIWCGGVALMIWLGEWLEEANERLLMLAMSLAAIVGPLLLLAGLGFAAAVRADEQRRKRSRESIPARISIALTCPRCEEEQEFRVGAASCASCGFTMFIEIEEPRCECGYLLYRLEGEVCPECGRTIPPEMRWRPAIASAGDPAASG